jgi:hypothetical protein
MPLGAPLAPYKISWSVQEQRRLSLFDTNITPNQNNKMQPESGFTFSPVQLYSTCNWGGRIKVSSEPLLSQRKLALTSKNNLFAL